MQRRSLGNSVSLAVAVEPHARRNCGSGLSRNSRKRTSSPAATLSEKLPREKARRPEGPKDKIISNPGIYQ